MGLSDPSHLVVGHLSKPHGTKGEIFVWPLTDHPESVFAPGVVFSLGNETDAVPNPDLPPLRVESVRPHQRGLLVQFGGVDDRSQAEVLIGRYLFTAIEDLAPLSEGEVFYHQLLQMTMVTVDGTEVGAVTEVFEMGPTDLLEVHGPKGVIMVPYRPEIIVDVDLEAGRLVIDPPEGLLDLQGAGSGKSEAGTSEAGGSDAGTSEAGGSDDGTSDE
jgi:16S rRNA processing protein RimM